MVSRGGGGETPKRRALLCVNQRVETRSDSTAA